MFKFKNKTHWYSNKMKILTCLTQIMLIFWACFSFLKDISTLELSLNVPAAYYHK